MDNTNEILEEEVYAYQVNTRMPIVGLSIGILKVPTTVKLTKEDVLICVKKAPVFRRFSNSDKERVGIGNIDRLHRAEHLTEEEYQKMIDKENDNRGKVSQTPVEEKKETVVEQPVQTEVVEDNTSNEIIDKTPEEPIVIEEKVNIESNDNQNKSNDNYKNHYYNNKKKHNH